jgi:hypothetical protein
MPMGAQRRVAAPVAAVAKTRDALAAMWLGRRERLWIAYVAVPLAELATGLLRMWWMWPPLLACARACAPRWRWAWVLSLELGFVGVVWATAGVSALVELPTQRVLVGAVWAASVLALAGAGIRNRHTH